MYLNYDFTKTFPYITIIIFKTLINKVTNKINIKQLLLFVKKQVFIFQ